MGLCVTTKRTAFFVFMIWLKSQGNGISRTMNDTSLQLLVLSRSVGFFRKLVVSYSPVALGALDQLEFPTKM